MKHKKVHAQCYPAAKSTALVVLGIALVAVGVVLVLFCVPVWAWLGLIGAGLVVLGLMLIKK